ncbi:MAG TPA: glycosyltransferase [Casimicrobiaceae bacterium]|nr:glycosyltransferase [Casimicrobiaceae bacterium]
MSDATATPLAIAHTESSLGWGGQEIRTLTEAAGFIARGHRVVVYAAPGARIVHEAPRFGVPIVALPIGRKRLRGVFSVSRALATDPVDIVNAHSSTDAWLAALACTWLVRTRRRAPVLVRTRHVSIPVPRDPATRWLYRRATARIVTTGVALREQLIRDNRFDADRIDSVPTGIDAAIFAPCSKAAARHALGLPQATPLIGIVATLRSWKGHRFLIDALPRVARRDARLCIVGDGPQRSALEAQVKALQLEARVMFAGQQADVAPWLAAFDAFALPSYANEGVPQALLQAMFMAIPCVTTDAGAIPEIARDADTARVVPREDAAALARAIDSLLDDPEGSAAMAERARAYVVPRFGLPAMLDRMEDVFRRALAARPLQ